MDKDKYVEEALQQMENPDFTMSSNPFDNTQEKMEKMSTAKEADLVLWFFFF